MIDLSSLRLNLLHAGYIDLDHKWNYDNVYSPFFRLYLIEKGEAEVYHSYGKFILKPHHLYLIPDFTFSRYYCPNSHTQYYLGVSQSLENGASIFDHFSFVYEVRAKEEDFDIMKRLLKLNPNIVLNIPNPEYYETSKKLKEAKDKFSEKPLAIQLETDGLLKIILSRFLIGRKGSAKRLKAIDDPRISRSIKYINENIHRPITVQEVAEKEGLQVDYFSKLFKDKYGMRPKAYITKIKVERSQLMIETTQHDIQVIASKVGFENISHFSKIFKKYIGVNPQEYKRGYL